MLLRCCCSLLLCINCVLYRIILISIKGTIVEHAERDQKLPKYLYAHVVLGVLQLGASLFGIAVIAGLADLPCSTSFTLHEYNVEQVLLSIVVISQLVDVFAVVFWIWVFKSSRVERPENTEPETHLQSNVLVSDSEYEAAANTFWEKQLRFLCKSAQICTCNMFGGSKVERDLEAVARVFALFFSHWGLLDVVPSDIVAGLILVRMQQLRTIDEANARVLTAAQMRNRLGSPKGDRRHKSKYASNNNFEMVDNADNAEASKDAGKDQEESKAGDVLVADVESGHIAINTDDPPIFDIQASRSPTNLDEVQLEYDNADFDDLENGFFGNFQRTTPLSAGTEADRQLMLELYQYSIFAVASYSHLLALYMQPVTGSCALCLARCRYVGKTAVNHGDDNGCCGRSDASPSRRSHSVSSPKKDDACACYCCMCCCAPKSLRLSVLEECFVPTSNADGQGHGHGHGGGEPVSPEQRTRERMNTKKYGYGRVMGDNCFKVNEAGLLHICKGRSNANLVYASFRNDSLCKPYAIFDGECPCW
jgi:hypothetical protein